MLKIFRKIVVKSLIGIIRFYQWAISPLLGKNCRFDPTCSEYSLQAFRRYGILKGIYLSVKRIIRCHPWGGHGYDPLQ